MESLSASDKTQQRPPFARVIQSCQAARSGSLITRRTFGRVTSLSSLAWLAAQHFGLADAVATAPRRPRARALIVLWLGGGPSQLETFDPKPGTAIAGPTRAIPTRVPGIELAAGLPQLAEQMEHVALVRSMLTKEGDHERGTYLMRTGYRPNPTVVHPALGAICAAELPEDRAEIPRYISILPSDKASRGGYLGEEFDAFRSGDPRDPLPDLVSSTADARRLKRLEDLDVVERAMARRYGARGQKTLHRETVDRAVRMMSSEQLDAFRVQDEPARVREGYGDTPFGRGCLAARRLIEAGVRCIEISLPGWDTHLNNFKGTAEQTKTLDPAFAALIQDLRAHDLFDSTLVLCTGEFGRTPRINPADGRDHWPTGFSLALAGGGIRGGQVIGETSPEGKPQPKDPCTVDDVYATILASMGIDPAKMMSTPIGRPIKLSEGKVIERLLA
jgi:hypothetical protein